MDYMIGSDEHPHTEADVWPGDFTFKEMPPGSWLDYSGVYVAVNGEGDGEQFIRRSNCECPFCTRLRITSRLLDVIRSWEGYMQNTGAICDALHRAADELIAERGTLSDPDGSGRTITEPKPDIGLGVDSEGVPF